jgi:hypothetical protein
LATASSSSRRRRCSSPPWPNDESNGVCGKIEAVPGGSSDSDDESEE